CLLTLNGSINLGSSELTTTGNDIVINGPINGSSTGRLIVQGGATLNGAGTYGGGTNVEGGMLGIGNDSAVGTGTLFMQDLTSIKVNGADHALANNVTLNGNIIVAASSNT